MRSIFWLALTLVFFLPAVANGCTGGPYSYVRESPNGKYLFVMLAPAYVEEADGPRNIFPASGMYLNDVSRTPLWTVDWYAESVTVFSDGVHIVRWEPWAESLYDEALTFFENGKPLRSYLVSDLVDTTLGSFRMGSEFHWEKEDGAKIHENNHTFSLIMASDEKYTFDYTTGEMVSARRPLRAFFVLAGATVLFLALRRFGKRR